MKSKTYRFTTGIQPEAEITLKGSHGSPLTMSITDLSSTKSVVMDTDSVMKLHTFLSDYLSKDEAPSTAPVYEPTGRALAVMDGDSLDVAALFTSAGALSPEALEDASYDEIASNTAAAGTELPQRAIFIFFDLYDGVIGRGVIKRVLRACISYQLDFVRTGDLRRCRQMGLQEIEDFTSIGISTVSRCSRRVRILSQNGTFTLDSADPSINTPSLFDEGVRRTDGSMCSRKEALSVMREAFAQEDPHDPWCDEDLSQYLEELGYDIARRTVTKYRALLGVPKRSERRVRP